MLPYKTNVTIKDKMERLEVKLPSNLSNATIGCCR